MPPSTGWLIYSKSGQMPDPTKMLREVIQEDFMHIICVNVHGGELVACMMKPRSNLCAANILKF